MLHSRAYDVIAVTAPGIGDAAIAIAAQRAGATGIVDLAGHTPESATAELDRCQGYVDGVGARFERDLSPDLGDLDLAGLGAIVLAGYGEDLPAAVAAARDTERLVLAEVRNVDEAGVASAAGVDGLIARGSEAGGFGGAESTFVLLQRVVQATGLPVWVAGGVGLHSAAAAVAAGARGIVLERQLALTRESALPDGARALFAKLDGSETSVYGARLDEGVRVLDRPQGQPAVAALARLERELQETFPAAARTTWRRAVAEALGWDHDRLWLLGQEAAFAAPLAETYRTVAGVIDAYRRSIAESIRTARQERPLARRSAWAASHGTEYPIAQGPMTRVSDTPAFAAAVAEGGGLPFIALALLDGQRSEKLLRETAEALGDRPWGVGILGFVEPELRAEQLAAIRAVRPPCALIAGGRPTQARELEADGIPCYLHVPSPRLLESFLRDGARKFVFEGRECGGHIGPRSSFVLWDQAVSTILEFLGDRRDEELCVLFAGGVHDAVSGAAVAALAAPLAVRGVRVGVLVGTAYLFTREAVESGAIVPRFQDEVLRCEATAVIETSPGHAIRVVPTPAVEAFWARRRELEAAGLGPRDVARELERLNLGRLRIASRGIARNPAAETDPTAPRYVELDEEEQYREGLYMVGEVAALHDQVIGLRELHESIAASAEALPDEPRAAHVTVEADPRKCEIAIVGMAALLPGANDVEEYWRNILAKVDSVTEVPRERWDPELYFDPNSRGGDRTYSKWGGFLAPILFDPLDYGIPPKSLRTIEPVHLLALETVRRALADAGYDRRPFDRERTAVVFGAGGGSSDLSNAFGFRGMLAHFLSAKPGLPDPDQIRAALDDVLPEWCEDTFPGVLINVIAGRVANRFNFGGANFTVDAACASSLAAVDAAVKELRLGHCDVAVAGGADTTQDIFSYLLFSNSLVLSPRGRCRTFDESADGIVIGEGVAAVVLKRLADAERDGDRIYAVIRGIAGSSDGRALGLTAPNLAGQARAVRLAYERAGLSPATVGLVEAHGTGTAVGDRTEIEALTAVYEAAGARPASVAIGSVKSNIGHTKCTAGLASLIKVARALFDRVLPPTLHVEVPNRKAAFGTNPFYPNSELRPWLDGTRGHPRRAAVSAFGFGGTNFHAVLEEYDRDVLPRPAPVLERSSEVLCFGGDSPAELASRLVALRTALEAGAAPRLRDLAYALWLRERDRPGALRLALVVSDLHGLPGLLADVAERLGESLSFAQLGPGVYFSAEPPLRGGGKLAFLFPGQGAQYPHMLSEVAVHFPVVREMLERADQVLRDEFENGLSALIYPPSAYSDEERQRQQEALTATDVAQPAIGACSAAMLALIRSFGLEPELVAGHSYGEYVALYAAGSIDFDTMLRLSLARGRAMAAAAAESAGGMAAVRADAETVTAALAGLAGITLANLNSPQQTVISGSEEALAAALERLAERKLNARLLPVACAFHSPLVAPAAERLRAALASVTFADPRVPVYSNTTAAPHETEAIAETLARHLTCPVRFVDELNAMADAGARVFLEVGPQRILTGLAERTLEDRAVAIATDQQGAGGVDRLHHALAQLYVAGAGLDLGPLFSGRDVVALNLDRLVDETRPTPPSPTAWLVAGGRAWPASEPPPERPSRQLGPAPQRAPGSLPVPTEVSLPEPPAGDGDVLGRYQALMAQALRQQERLVREALESQQRVMESYLATQRAVMSAYLSGEATLDVPAAPAPAVDATSTPEREPEPAEPTSTAPAETEVDITATLLQLVAERTGYPPHTIGLDLDIEAELGIDSIKRIEILSGLTEYLPTTLAVGLEEGLEELAQQKTIRQVVAWLEQRVREQAAQGEAASIAPAPAGERESREAAEGGASRVARHVLRVVAAPAPGVRNVPGGRSILILGRHDLAGAVAERLKAHDLVPVLPRVVPSTAEEAAKTLGLAGRLAPLGGLVWVADHSAAPEAALKHCTALLLLAQAAAEPLTAIGAGGFGVLTITTMDGRCGLAGGADPVAGALAGLTKSLARELPTVPVKVVDVSPDEPLEVIAAAAVEEQFRVGSTVEVGLASGERTRVDCVEAPAEGDGVALDAESVVLVTGGARGITAEVAVAIASATPCRLVLVGRTPLPDGPEDEATAGLEDLAALKAALAERLGRSAGPAAIEAAYRRLSAEREVRRNLARLAETGAPVEYHAVDVANAAAVRDLVEGLYEGHGRIDVVIHGAGTIEDKRLRDKTPEIVERVFAAKVGGALNLVAHLRPESLRCLVFFTSVAGRFGNLGQTDYAAANEFLSKLARRLDAEWAARVVATAWGPWDEVGMVQPELRRLMRERGVGLVSPQDGCRLLLEELRHGAKGEAEVVFADLSAGADQVL